MTKMTAGRAILDQLARENRRVLSEWRALLLLRRATFDIRQDARRWSAVPDAVQDVRPLLSQMEQRGELAPVPKLSHMYEVTVPYARKGEMDEAEVLMEVHPYAAISHLSALVFHGLSDDMPLGLTVIVPAYRGGTLPPGTTPEDWEGMSPVAGRTPPTILRVPVHWTRVAADRYFGLREYRPRGYPIRVTTPERALVDGLLDPQLCGGLDNVLQAWARTRDTLDLDDLIEIVDEFGVAVLRQRVGYVLDRLDLAHPTVEAWRAGAKRGGSSKLLGSAPYDGACYSERWNLSINAPVAALVEGMA